MKTQFKKINNNLKEKGFINIIVTIIIVLVILAIIGFDINSVWSSFFKPIFSFIGNSIVFIANWVYSLVVNIFRF